MPSAPLSSAACSFGSAASALRSRSFFASASASSLALAAAAVSAALFFDPLAAIMMPICSPIGLTASSVMMASALAQTALVLAATSTVGDGEDEAAALVVEDEAGVAGCVGGSPAPGAPSGKAD